MTQRQNRLWEVEKCGNMVLQQCVITIFPQKFKNKKNISYFGTGEVSSSTTWAAMLGCT